MIDQSLISLSPVEKTNGQNETSQFTKISSTASSNPVEVTADKQASMVSEKEPIANGDLAVNTLKEIELRFVPDDNSNQITVYVVDKASKSVLRSIPPEDIGKLEAGELLQLSA